MSDAENRLRGAYADARLTPLEGAAMAWLDGFYQVEHLLATRAWTLMLRPQAPLALSFAALVHDAERFFPGGPKGGVIAGPDDPDYLMSHSARSADLVDAWLADRADVAEPGFRERVRALILRHEFGGDPEEDVLQAADSLAFLSTFDWLVVEWVRTGFATREQAQKKLDWMLCRIRVPQAVALALPHYRATSRTLANPRLTEADLARRRQLAGDVQLLLGGKNGGGQKASSTA